MPVIAPSNASTTPSATVTVSWRSYVGRRRTPMADPTTSSSHPPQLKKPCSAAHSVWQA